MPEILLGKPVVDAIAGDLKSRIAALSERGIVPSLAIVRIGHRPDDLSYERTARRRAEGLGIAVRSIELENDASQGDLLETIRAINCDDGIHGCLIFRPLPNHIDERATCDALEPSKDVDGAGTASLAGVYAGGGMGFAPCTAAACIEMLDHYGIAIEGKRACVVGRSLVIGRPVASLLLERNATVTLCHSRTPDLASVMRESDIVVLATGRARAFGAQCFREGQVVLDVGINFDAAGVMCGDADFDMAESALGDTGAITPVPRGIGGVTTSVLMKHTVEAAEAAARSRF